MSRAARRRDQVDASQSGVRLHFDRRFISQPSALAVRADCENQLGSVRLRALHPLSAVGDPRVEVSFQSSSCCFGPGFCLPKPWSVILYRATARAVQLNIVTILQLVKNWLQAVEFRIRDPSTI